MTMVLLDASHLADRTWRGLVRVLGRRRFATGSGSGLVDWAVEALVARWASPSLNVLGGLAKPPNEFEVDRYVAHMMEELGVEMPDEGGLADLYARAIAQDLLAGAVSPYEGARELNHLWTKLGYPERLQSWVGFETKYELARDGVCGDMAEVERQILGEAQRLLDEGQ